MGHKRLLYKLEAYGVTGKTKDIVKDFLTDRYFRVKVGSTFSKNYKVTSGVPQGSVLGPLLFLVFINDLPDGIKSFVSLFADDVKMVTKTSDLTVAQQDLELLNQWQKNLVIIIQHERRQM